MSISQLCQQDPSDDENHRDLDQDPFELNSDDEHNHHHNTNGNHDYHTNGHSNGNGNSNGHHHTNGGAHYSNSSDEFEEFDDRPRSSPSSRPDDEQLAAEALGDMANSIPSSAPTAPFISRMSSLPIVNSALKAYESGKQNSKVMKVTTLYIWLCFSFSSFTCDGSDNMTFLWRRERRRLHR